MDPTLFEQFVFDQLDRLTAALRRRISTWEHRPTCLFNRVQLRQFPVGKDLLGSESRFAAWIRATHRLNPTGVYSDEFVRTVYQHAIRLRTFCKYGFYVSGIVKQDRWLPLWTQAECTRATTYGFLEEAWSAAVARRIDLSQEIHQAAAEYAGRYVDAVEETVRWLRSGGLRAPTLGDVTTSYAWVVRSEQKTYREVVRRAIRLYRQVDPDGRLVEEFLRVYP